MEKEILNQIGAIENEVVESTCTNGESKKISGMISNLTDLIIKNKELSNWTNNDIDLAFILGCINVGGIDGVCKEINRLKKIGYKPHEAIKILKS